MVSILTLIIKFFKKSYFIPYCISISLFFLIAIIFSDENTSLTIFYIQKISNTHLHTLLHYTSKKHILQSTHKSFHNNNLCASYFIDTDNSTSHYHFFPFYKQHNSQYHKNTICTDNFRY